MTRLATILLAALAVVLTATAGAARPRHHRAAAAPAQQPPAPHALYPEHVEGGVNGNYTFNNQVWKHTDPLNANGGK